MESYLTSYFRITVNYSWSLKKMIRKGKYKWCDPGITKENFPINKRKNGPVEILLVKFRTINGKSLYSTQEALQELKKLGMRPVELPELLALGAQYPDKQMKSPIHGLGSIIQEQELAPCLDNNLESLGGRGVTLGSTEKNLPHHAWCRFAAVKE